MKNNQKSKTDYITESLYCKINCMVERLKQPSTWRKIGWVVIALISMYYNLDYRITSLEDFRQSVDVIQLQTDIAQMKIDLQRIKNDLANKK
jgi:hypothetical protein